MKKTPCYREGTNEQFDADFSEDGNTVTLTQDGHVRVITKREYEEYFTTTPPQKGK